ncbi:hypothetical protein ACFV00_15355 [Streptomyces californicus]|uniref:hypothetical protein n=1 Tax=Streptomyces californicus TaxID=67351 RepID=UPI00369E9BF7
MCSLPLRELRKLLRLAEDQERERRCHSYHQGGGPCVLENGHQGPHRNDSPAGNGGTATKPDSAVPHAVITMWEFF